MIAGSIHRWQEGKRLVRTTGSEFPYQPPEGIVELLAEQLQDHYNNYKRFSTDKKDHPLFLVLSGAGTGKSRFLDEFHALCLAAVQNSSSDLEDRIQNAFVFKISYENGHSGDNAFVDGAQSLGTRMLYQLSDQAWDQKKGQPFVKMTPPQVMRLVAKLRGKKLSDLTFILLVDGMQELPHEALDKDTKFYSVLQTISNQINGWSSTTDYPFVIGCCSATFYTPVSKMLADSNQRRIDIQIPSIDGQKIFDSYSQDPLISLLIDDMGGHGRALEALWETLSLFKFKIENHSLQKFMDGLRSKLELDYPTWVDKGWISKMKPLLGAILTRQRFEDMDTQLPGNIGTVDDFVRLGLFRWNRQEKTIDAPYVLLWLICSSSNDPVLQNLLLGDYKSLQHVLNPTVHDRGTQSWMHWEEFIARFRCLKSRVLEGRTVMWTDIHAGAKFGANTNLMVKVKALTLVHASRQYPTNTSESNMQIDHEGGTGQLSDSNLLVMNKYAAKGADAFCSLELESGEIVKEGIQMRKVKNATTVDMLENEIKSSKNPKDFFLYITTGPSFIEEKGLSERCALVDSSRLLAYFGPYAGRAFFFFPKAVNINTATRSQLLSVRGIGPKFAARILEEREKMAFLDAGDCYVRTKVPKKFLAMFRF